MWPRSEARQAAAASRGKAEQCEMWRGFEAADCGSWTAVEQLDNTLRLEAAEAAQGHVTSTSASSPEIEAWVRLHEDD